MQMWALRCLVPASVSYVNNPLRASLAPDGCKGIPLNHCHPLDATISSLPCNRQLILLYSIILYIIYVCLRACVSDFRTKLHIRDNIQINPNTGKAENICIYIQLIFKFTYHSLCSHLYFLLPANYCRFE